MTDRELLELAAKAAGIDCDSQLTDKQFQKWGLWLRHDPADGEPRNWNPLNDDGDALKLAVKLDLGIELQTDSVWANGIGVQNYQLFEWHNNDKFKATRRAIVRAAAEIGKSMP